MTFLAPFSKINEYNKNTQSNIFNICIQEVIRGHVNWTETNLVMRSKPQNTVFWWWENLDLSLRSIKPITGQQMPFWQLSIDHNMDVHYQVKHRFYMPWTTS